MDSEKLRELILKYVPELKDADKNDNGLCHIGNKLRIKLLGKEKDGFYFYSSRERDSGQILLLVGPWLKKCVAECFSECTRFAEVDYYGRPAKREEAGTVKVALQNLVDVNDTEEESLRNALKKLSCVLDEFRSSDNKEKLDAEIEKYNRENKTELEQYIRCRSQNQADMEENSLRNYETMQLPDFQNEIKNLLESNLQVILTGAPGTGKTYTARQVAEKMITEGLSSDDEKKEAMDKRFKSVQFHPGYDYSDFVIGMKPVLVSDDGREVFKDDAGLLYTTDDGKKDGKKTPFSGKTNVSFLWKDGVFKKFADNARKDMNHTFVFLIDEINRADLSRVFGELFSLLEEEYRYPNNQKGITLPNGETFHIPANLCIIGTMNDIDRSVESMDFALRRRFAWKEIRAKDTQADILEKVPAKDDLIAKMDAVNAIIEKELGQEYELGAAIFEKYKKCNSFDELWANHIEIILNEYLRGRHNRQVLQDDLKNAFSSTASHAPETNSGDNDAKTPSIGQN